jgi:hypothetical protein
MTTPTVTELPRALEATTTDFFINHAPSRLVLDALDQRAKPAVLTSDRSPTSP